MVNLINTMRKKKNGLQSKYEYLPAYMIKVTRATKKKGTKKNRSSHRRCSIKKLFLKISQNSQENTCARVSFLNKSQVAPATILKKEALAQNFAKFLRTPFLQNISGTLLLKERMDCGEQCPRPRRRYFKL